MSEQTTRALYLGCYLLMLVLAFSSFFSTYRDYQTTISQVWNYTDTQGVAMEEPYTESNGYMTGNDVVNLILARRRADMSRLFVDLYEDSTDPVAFEEYPELLINGESYQDCQVEGIEPDSAFQTDTTFDTDGKPIRIEIRGR